MCEREEGYRVPEWLVGVGVGVEAFASHNAGGGRDACMCVYKRLRTPPLLGLGEEDPCGCMWITFVTPCKCGSVRRGPVGSHAGGTPQTC